MTAVKAAVETYYASGHCAVGSHDRCRGLYAGVACQCACGHRPPEPVPEAAVVTVHCFFGCGRQEIHGDPVVAHDAMEAHYFAAHRERIRAIVGWLAP